MALIALGNAMVYNIPEDDDDDARRDLTENDLAVMERAMDEEMREEDRRAFLEELNATNATSAAMSVEVRDLVRVNRGFWSSISKYQIHSVSEKMGGLLSFRRILHIMGMGSRPLIVSFIDI